MRNIKFRIWNGKEMDYFELCNDFDCHVGWLEGRVLMQWTGLKDKNGVDIYEGDILQTGTDKLMVVGWSNKFASFILQREGWVFSHWFGEACDPEDCEIKGNIHTDKNLLK